jgi:hypothetical protein
MGMTGRAVISPETLANLVHSQQEMDGLDGSLISREFAAPHHLGLLSHF